MFENYNIQYIESYIVSNDTDLQTSSVLVSPYTQEDCYNLTLSLVRYAVLKNSSKIEFPPDLLPTIGFNVVFASLTGPVDNPSNLYYSCKILSTLYGPSEGENGQNENNPFMQIINDFLSGHSGDIVNICTNASSLDDCIYCSDALLLIQNWGTFYGVTLPSAIATAETALKSAFDALTISTPEDLIRSTVIVDNLRRIAENDQKYLITDI